MVVHAYNSSILEAEAGGFQQELSQWPVYNEFETSLGYRVRHCLKITNTQKDNLI